MLETFEMADDYHTLLGSRGLGSLAGVFAWASGQRLDKPGLERWRQRWRIGLKDDDGVERTFYLKRFDRPSLRRQIERWRNGRVTLSTGGREWDNARQLAAAGVAAVRPVAYGQRMCGPWEFRSCIVLSEVAGESLERWLPMHVPPAEKERNLRRRRALGDQLGRFVARFHRAGFVHRDLYLSHVFIRQEGADSAGEIASAGEVSSQDLGDGTCDGTRDNDNELFCLIDVQRVFRPWFRRQRWVVKDLAQLNYSTPADRVGRWERLRFLCRYVRECGEFGSTRQLAQLVGAKTAGMVRRRPNEQNAEGTPARGSV